MDKNYIEIPPRQRKPFKFGSYLDFTFFFTLRGALKESNRILKQDGWK